MDRQIDDQDSLIESRNQANNQIQSKYLVKYIISKLFPFLWTFFASFLIPSSSLIYFFTLIFAIIDLWLCRRKYSYSLVGLTWNLEMPDPQLSFEDMVAFQIEPDPFVASTRDSNVFWLLLCGTTAYYVLLTIISLLKLHIIAFFFLIIISFLEITNLFLYLKCLNISKKQSEETVKSVMINTVHSEFLNAVPVIEEIDVSNNQKAQGEKIEDKKMNDIEHSVEKESAAELSDNNKDDNKKDEAEINDDTKINDEKDNQDEEESY